MSWKKDLGRNFTQADKYEKRFDKLPPGQYTIEAHPMLGIFLQESDPPRDASNITTDSLSDRILSEIEKFQGMRERYRELGLLYKRGIILHGEPGCGKTTLVHHIAERMVAQGAIVLHGRGRGLVNAYRMIRQHDNDTCILIVMEDIDEYGDSPGLVNFLDGVSGVNNAVFLATTNYLERVPPRLRNRPSRFDTVMKMGRPSKPVRSAYLAKLGVSGAELDELAEKSEGLSFAHLKELFIATQLFEQPVETAARRLKPGELAISDSSGEGAPMFMTPDEESDEDIELLEVN